MLNRLLWLIILGLLFGCDNEGRSSSQNQPTTSVTTDATTASTDTVADAFIDSSPPCKGNHPDNVCHVVDFKGRERHFWLHNAPSSEEGKRPLLIVLHGLLAGTEGVDFVVKARGFGDRFGYMVLLPSAFQLNDLTGVWNSFVTCCDTTNTPLTTEEQKDFEDVVSFLDTLDDVQYIGTLIDTMVQERQADPNKIFILGHSNGGVMAHRLACETPEKITGIVSLAGPYERNLNLCQPSRPVPILHLHSTGDDTVSFDGGIPEGVGPGSLVPALLGIINSTTTFSEASIRFVAKSFWMSSAHDTVKHWAQFNGCKTGEGALLPPIVSDPISILEDSRNGDEILKTDSSVLEYQDCTHTTKLIVIDEQGGHVPGLYIPVFHQILSDFFSGI